MSNQPYQAQAYPNPQQQPMHQQNQANVGQYVKTAQSGYYQQQPMNYAQPVQGQYVNTNVQPMMQVGGMQQPLMQNADQTRILMLKHQVHDAMPCIKCILGTFICCYAIFLVLIIGAISNCEQLKTVYYPDQQQREQIAACQAPGVGTALYVGVVQSLVVVITYGFLYNALTKHKPRVILKCLVVMIVLFIIQLFRQFVGMKNVRQGQATQYLVIAVILDGLWIYFLWKIQQIGNSMRELELFGVDMSVPH